MKNEKLTLRIEKNLVEKAKKFALEHDTSVSRMVAGFFDNLGQPRSIRHHGPMTTRLRGSLKPKGVERGHDEDDYRRHLEQKHG